MKFRPTTNLHCTAKRLATGFTLAEVLAALVFMAIVIPVAIEGVRLASLAGQLAERKSAAVRMCELALNQALLNRQWQQPSQTGMIREAQHEYRWSMQLDPWLESSMRNLTVRVVYTVQGQDYEVSLSTLVDITQ